jgi:hypothetical protein
MEAWRQSPSPAGKPASNVHHKDGVVRDSLTQYPSGLVTSDGNSVTLETAPRQKSITAANKERIRDQYTEGMLLDNAVASAGGQ